MSKFRPTLTTSQEPGLNYGQTYHRVLESVKIRRSLIHGKLYDGPFTCSIGAYFRDSKIPLDSKALDEIAAYNDSFPHLSRAQRWKKVTTWLKAKVQTINP